MVKSQSEQTLDLLAQLAGEEFVASGRAAEEDRSAHRSRGQMLADMLRELRRRDSNEMFGTERLIVDHPVTETDTSSK